MDRAIAPDELEHEILFLAGAVRSEAKRFKHLGDFLFTLEAPEKRAECKSLLNETNETRQQLVADIRHLAGVAALPVRTKLLQAAVLLQGTSGEGVYEMLAEAAALVGHSADSPSRIAHPAHHQKLFPKGDLTDSLMQAAIVALATERAPGVNDTDILRRFDKEPTKLAARIRKARQDGWTTLAPGN